MTALHYEPGVLRPGAGVLHVIDSAGLYGAERVLLTLAAEQQRRGQKVRIATIREPGETECALEEAAAREGLETVVFRAGWGISFSIANAILRYAGDHSLDVIHSHGYKPNLMLSAVSTSHTRVSTIHGWTAMRRLSKLWIYEWLDRCMLTRLDAVVAVSNEMAARFELPARLGDRLHVVHNGLPELCSAEAPLGIPAEVLQFCARDFTVAAIGRLSEEKGIDVLLRALASLNEGGRPVQALIIGDGPERADLLRQAHAAGLAERVFFAGYIEDAARCLSCVDVYVLPSRTEGLPLVLLEAARAGLPIVSTAVGGVPEVIEHERSGLLCATENSDAMAGAIDRIRVSKQLAAGLGRAAQDAFERGYTARVMASAYLQVYGRASRYRAGRVPTCAV